MSRLNIYKVFFFFSASILFSTNAVGQCPEINDDISFDGQAELEAFLVNNPSCTYIYSMEISGDVTDISGLSSLTSISYLYLSDCPLLTDISALGNIDSIHGNLGIEKATGFTDLLGLNVEYIGQDLRIEETSNLENLRGLESLNVILDDLEITGNTALSCLSSLESVFMENERINITNNPLLDNCCGVQHLLNTSMTFTIENNLGQCNSINDLSSADCSQSCVLSASKIFVVNGSIFPNPADTEIVLEFSDHFERGSIEIITISGIVVLAGEVHDGSVIDISAIPEGVYFIKAYDGSKTRLFRSRLVVY